MKKLCLLLTLSAFLTYNLANAGIIYVKAGISGATNSGTSWSDAFDNLQAALDKAKSNDTIWVAKGTYYPSTIAGTTTDTRDKAFLLKDKVSLFGGFKGTEVTLDERILDNTNASILSGDLGSTNNSDNVYHVVLAIEISNQTTLDGFTIKKGNANGIGSATIKTNLISRDLGAGIYTQNSVIVLNNLLVDSNSSSRGGAAINNENSNIQLNNSNITHNEILGKDLIGVGGGAGINNVASNPILNNVRIENNKASSVQGGGGMKNVNSSPQLNDVVFKGNQLTTGIEGDGGGAMYNLNTSNPILKHVTFQSNTTDGGGGGMYNDNSIPELSFVRFLENKAEAGGGMENDGNSHAILHDVLFKNNEASEDGGAVYNWKSNPNLKNVVFEGNKAKIDGGGIYNYNDASPILTHVMFKSNKAGRNGGGIYNRRNANPILTNTLIIENTAGENGGGIYIVSSNSEASSPILTNVTIANNTAAKSGGGGYDDGIGKTKLRNSIISGNNAANLADIDAPVNMLATAINSVIIDDEFYLGGLTLPVAITGNIFVNMGNKDYRLAQGSSGIDKGDNSLFGSSVTPNLSAITIDINGADRIMGNKIDLGAFEACSDTVEAKVSLAANPSIISVNTTITFTATPVNGGLYPNYKWFKNNTIIPNVTGSKYTGVAGVDFQDGDTISTVLYSSLSCANYDSAASKFPLEFTVGISNVKDEGSPLKVYPNPNTGNFHIQTKLLTGKKYELYMTDILGRKLYFESFTAQKNTFQKELNFNHSLLPGIYFLMIHGEGNLKQVSRILIR